MKRPLGEGCKTLRGRSSPPPHRQGFDERLRGDSCIIQVVKTRSGGWLALSLFLSGAGSRQTRAEHRVEVEQTVQQIAQGQEIESGLARIHYLGEEDYAASVAVSALQRAPDERERRNLAFALGVLGAHGSEATLIALAHDPDPVVRMSAAQGLGRVHSRDVRTLGALLKDPSMPVRVEGAKALGALHQAKFGKALLEAARTESEPEARAVILVAAGDCADPRLAKGLAGFLTSSSESTRSAAARALCHLGAPQGLTYARKQLESAQKLERRQAVALFEGAPASAARAVLRPLLKDPDAQVAASAARILYQGGEAVMLDWLVVASFHAKGEEKLTYENELEKLHLDDAQRGLILRRAGLK